ncbi:nucleotidyltransferase domain-containing protein [Exiguobacterium aurantiacum]|uniref:Nucleotidyltransferase domain-containing protein n=1 Tax=Exiguobacterium aurantiacum TaxID=33987 RepID=A0ABY5FN09_9BACL|nr:nucleotidyltransferase domain-containing protein [Exiguobacterium aurantiacum]UTT42951.1 nucleotidyltransferase domain-containing protein [Exiguobacterium aurantiacum]
MRQQAAIATLTDSLISDADVQAIFLKGSFGRGEADEHSDVDLYVMVAHDSLNAFLSRRRDHLATYRPILLEDEIDIVAPQLIVVYDDFLHLDFFTVTADTLNHQDAVTVLYDPEHRLQHHSSSLTLSDEDLGGHVIDAIWFFFQYTKARDRGNDVWAVEMLRQGMSHFAYALAAHYEPERAALGLKDVAARQRIEIRSFYEALTPDHHATAARWYVARLEAERSFFKTTDAFEQIGPFLDHLMAREKSRS